MRSVESSLVRVRHFKSCSVTQFFNMRCVESRTVLLGSVELSRVEFRQVMSSFYLQIKAKRKHPNLPVYHWQRQPREQWDITRQRIHERDKGVCQSPIDSPPKRNGLCQWNVTLDKCHIDHVNPLMSGGSNHASNLRTLCPVCHSLRVDPKHRGMQTGMVKKGLLPIDWKRLVWE